MARRARATAGAADILVMATPTWLGQPSSVAKRALERMDALLSETHDDDATPIAHGRVAGVVVTGNEDGAHHVIAEIAGALIDIGYTVPGQAWTYWNKGPGPGDWHGAAPERFMAHIAMQQNDESGSPVTWGEHVTDEQYSGARSA
jgi:multimeric flavodoxin WrbA